MIYHILRSYNGLSTTHNRLMLGLCITDIISSSAHIVAGVTIPQEMNYLYPHAKGNVASCAARGIFIVFGAIAGALYICALCFYYLAIVRYNKKDNYIKEKLDYGFMGFLSTPVILVTILATLKAFNNPGNEGSFCFAYPYNPPHCIGLKGGSTPEGFHIPCGRGDLSDKPLGVVSFFLIGQMVIAVLTPLVIFCTMALMYKSVLRLSRRMQSYGASALRLTAPPSD
jgi:hypothetical protein